MTTKQQDDISEVKRLVDNLEGWFKYYAEAYNVLHNDIVQKKIQIPGQITDLLDKIEILQKCYYTLHNAFMKREIHPEFETQVNLIIKRINESTSHLKSIISDEEAFRNEMRQTMKFIGSHIHSTEVRLQSLEEQFSKKIKVKLFIDDEEQVNRKESDFITPVMALNGLLMSLTAREQFVLKNRLGLLGEKAKTFDQIAALLGLKSRERVSQIFKKCIVKCRHTTRKKYIKYINNPILETAINGTSS